MSLTFLTGYVLGQHGAQSARVAATAATHGGPTTLDLHDIEERVDRLVLVVDALWSLLEDRGFSDEELMARIHEIDAADGSTDGKRTDLPSDCGGCGAKVAAGLAACQFCGTTVSSPSGGPLAGV